MINSEGSVLQNKTMRTVCAVELWLLHRLLRHTTFCAFEKVREMMIAERGTGNNDKAARGRSS